MTTTVDLKSIIGGMIDRSPWTFYFCLRVKKGEACPYIHDFMVQSMDPRRSNKWAGPGVLVNPPSGFLCHRLWATFEGSQDDRQRIARFIFEFRIQDKTFGNFPIIRFLESPRHMGLWKRIVMKLFGVRWGTPSNKYIAPLMNVSATVWGDEFIATEDFDLWFFMDGELDRAVQ